MPRWKMGAERHWWKGETSALGRDELLSEETRNLSWLKKQGLSHLQQLWWFFGWLPCPFQDCHLHMALALSILILLPAFLLLFLV